MAVDYMVRDQLRELWVQIDRLHLNYLQTDESPRKIDERKRLEGYIREYLYLATHEAKFCFRETAEVLHRSVERQEEFSPYRATAAWTAIAAYAHNLLAQPWRKEFHEIKTYCGYYKHNLESNLVGAELMLEAMGYKHSGRSTLVLDGPVDPDRVTMVSRDSLVALVECQIIRSIYAEVFKVMSSCTWLEVLQYRETHVCTPEQAVRGLTYRLHQRRYEEQQQFRTQMDSYNTVSRYHHPMEQCPYAPRYHYNYTMPSPRYGVISPPHQLPPSYPMYPIKPHEVYPSNYYPVQNGYIPLPVPPPPVLMPNYSCSVPTAQLIELDLPHEPPSYTTNTHRRSSSDHRVEHEVRKNGERYPSDVCSRSTTSDDLGSRKSGKKEGNWDSNWGYVYQRLEEKGGKKKEEFIEKRKENKRPPSPLDLDDALKAFSLDDLHQLSVPDQRTLKINEALNKIKLDEVDGKKRENRVSLYDNSSPPSSSSPKQIQTAPVKDSKKSEDSKLLGVNVRKLTVKLSDKWECVACTYHNSGTRDVCEMCGKSRNRGGEMKPLASGGRQCPQCTLVNEKGVTTCEACGSSLKDSPTYI